MPLNRDDEIVQVWIGHFSHRRLDKHFPRKDLGRNAEICARITQPHRFDRGWAARLPVGEKVSQERMAEPVPDTRRAAWALAELAHQWPSFMAAR